MNIVRREFNFISYSDPDECRRKVFGVKIKLKKN